MLIFERLRQGLAWRVIWLAFGLGIGGLHLIDALSESPQMGLALRGVGLILLGLSWFLAPLHPGMALKSELKRGSLPALGSPGLRMGLTLLGLALVVVGWLI